MIDMIFAHPHLFWLSLGGLLLAAEMLGGSGYLLWSGVAGVVTGALTWLLPLSWEWQGTLFAVLTLLAAWLWAKWLRKRVKTQRPADAQLNQRGQQLVGRRLTLDAPLVNGRGHVRVGDSSWPVIADEDLAAGSKVEVIAVEGITLRIRPADRYACALRWQQPERLSIIGHSALSSPGQDSASASRCARIFCSSRIWFSISATFSSVRFFTSALCRDGSLNKATSSRHSSRLKPTCRAWRSSVSSSRSCCL